MNWERTQKRQFDRLEKAEEKLFQRLNAFYKREVKSLEKEVAEYYARYGKENVIEYNKLMLSLDEQDVQMLLENMDDFVRKYPQYAHLMPVRESIYKLNRLQGLQHSFYTKIMETGAMEEEELQKHLAKVYETGNRTVVQSLGLSDAIGGVRRDAIIRTLGNKWVNGENFNDRIRNNRRKLSNYINNEVRDGFIRGDSYDRIIRAMEERYLKIARNDIRKLVRTEGTYVMNEANAQVFEEHFQEYKYSAVLDRRTTRICRSMDGTIFKWEDRQAGVNFPPMHPSCRSSFEVIIPDDWLDREMRRANPGAFK